MEALFLGFSELGDFVRELSKESEVFSARKFGDNFFWQKHLPDGSTPFVMSAYRTSEPLKSFFFAPRKTVAVYPQPAPTISEAKTKTILFGAKACDLRSLSILDRVFLEGDFKDPFYTERRDTTVIVASDCTGFRDGCFCIALGIDPYPHENCDVCLSEISDGYLLSVGSPKGQSFLQEHDGRLSSASQAQVDERGRRRAEILRTLGGKLAADQLPDKDSHRANVTRNFQSGIWESRAKDCVECGACNLVCPTCHCFVLEDYTVTGGSYGRTRLWDSCQYKGFARVAGGANPRKKLAERVRNRFLKKFDFFPGEAGIYACTGCGRCTEACIARIDIKEVLKELAAV